MSRRAIIEHGTDHPNARINTITIESAYGNEFQYIMTKRELEVYAVQVKTMYKCKDKNIYPAKCSIVGGSIPGGGVNLGSNQGK
jgi:hypothetical protein